MRAGYLRDVSTQARGVHLSSAAKTLVRQCVGASDCLLLSAVVFSSLDRRCLSLPQTLSTNLALPRLLLVVRDSTQQQQPSRRLLSAKTICHLIMQSSHS